MQIPGDLLAIGIAAVATFIVVVVVVIAFIVKNKKNGGQKLDAIDMAEQAERVRIRSVLTPEEYERAMELRYKNKTDEAETKEYDALIAKSWELTRRRATDKQTQNTLTPDEHERWKALSRKTINMTEAELTEYDALERKRMQSPPPLATSQGTPGKKKRHWGWMILAIVLGGLAGGFGKLAGGAISVVAFAGTKESAQGFLMALVIGAIIVFFIVKSNKKARIEKQNQAKDNRQVQPKKTDIDFHLFVRQCLFQRAKITENYLMQLTELLENSKFKTHDSKYMLGVELDVFTTMLMYLFIQQAWRPFRAQEAKSLQEHIFDHMEIVVTSISDKWNVDAIKNRVNDYNDIVQKKVQHYGQSLYKVTNDKTLAHLKSNSIGRCAILFTDFVYFTLIDNDFATMETMRQVVVLDMLESVRYGKVMSAMFNHAINVAKDIQDAIEKESNRGQD